MASGWWPKGTSFPGEPRRPPTGLPATPAATKTHLQASLAPEPSGETAGAFRYATDAEAFTDGQALAFVSGPTYERYGEEGTASTVPLGDLKLGGRIWRGPNRSAAPRGLHRLWVQPG